VITTEVMERRIQHCVQQISGISDMEIDQNRELVALKKK